MFGKSMFRLAALVVAGGVALVLGSQLLTSAVGIVTAFREGNPVQLILLSILTVVFLRIPGRSGERTPVRMFLQVLGWGSAVYLFFVVLVGMLPYGILAAFVSAGITAILCSAISDPTELKARLDAMKQATESIGFDAQGLGLANGADSVQSLWARISKLDYSVIVLPPDSSDRITSLLRSRPKLPVCVMHLYDNDMMIVTSGKEWLTKMLSVLKESGIENAKAASSLLTKTVLGLPIIEQEHGVDISDYQIILNETTIEKLLKMQPLRMSLFPGPEGLRALVRGETTLGLETHSIPNRHLTRAVLGRDISFISRGESKIDNTA
jgi:hypothetical protein